MNRAYKFRIYPNREQIILIQKTFGCVRFLYNKMLSDKKAYYDRTKERLHVTPAQYKNEFPWLKEVDSLALANAAKNLKTAYEGFFRLPERGFPKFKSKHRNRKSYTTNNVNGSIRIEEGHLKLPKLGFIKLKQHRGIPKGYVLKSVTVSQTPSGHYEASILFFYESQVERQELHDFIGLDFSMGELYVDSNGNQASYPRYYRKSERKLKKEQRKLSRMQKGSKNRQKQRRKVAKLHERVSNQRKDFLHKRSKALTDAYDAVCIETLNMRSMAKSLHFGKSVHDNGWGMFVSFLEYKAKERGKKVIRVGRLFPSSQLCSNCGFQNPEVKDLSIREWVCPVCGAFHNRDVNAAINIQRESIRMALA